MLNFVFEVNGGLSYIAKLTLFIKLRLVSALVKKRSFSTLKTKVHLKEKGNFPMRHPVLKFQGWEPRIVGFVICTSLDIFILSSRANFLAERPVSETKNLRLFLFCSGSELELPEPRRGYPNSITVDFWSWIFKEFRDRGYATLYSEDDEYYVFNYQLHGFRDPLADHYTHPFWQAAQSAGYCIKSTPQP